MSESPGKVYKYDPENRGKFVNSDRDVIHEHIVHTLERNIDGSVATASEIISKTKHRIGSVHTHEAINNLIEEGVLEGDKITREGFEIRDSFSEKSTVPPSIKETLAEEGEEFYDDVNDILRKYDRKTRATTALKLACDEYGCATSLEAGAIAPTRKMTEVRNETGIRQILDPRQVVDATVVLVSQKKRNDYGSEDEYQEDEFVENSDKVADIAEALLEGGDGEILSGNPKINAASAVYLAASLEDYDITQRDVAEAVGISEVPIKQNYTEILGNYTTENDLISEVPESELDDVRDQIYEEVK
jgi:hypothetical protein